MKKIEIAEFLAETRMPSQGGWGVKTWTNHFMKHSKAELEMLLDAATNPNKAEAQKLRDAAHQSRARREDGRGQIRVAGRIR